MTRPRHGSVPAFLLLLTLSSQVACAGEGAGVDASSTSSGAAKDDASATCADACSHIVACANLVDGSELSVVPCETQCALELAGDGYLDREVAMLGFASKRLLSADSSCEANFNISDEIIASDYQTLSTKNAIDDCQAAYMSSSCTSIAATAQRSQCFDLFFKYAPRFRKGIEQCGYPAMPCDQWEKCLDGSRPPVETDDRQPWYGRDFGSTM